MTPAVRAVLFDIGGVIADSPVMAIRRHCRQVGVPDINSFLGASDAWNAYMRGDLSRSDFVHNLTREMEVASQAPLDVEALLDDVFGAQGGHRPLMIRALKRLRRKHGGLLIGALTNNWVAEPEVDEAAEVARQAETAAFRALFDVFVESSVTGLQKPDPRIYQLALSQLGQLPAESVVFLDDLGVNLKAARALGIRTIKVNNETEWQWLEALAELETCTGVELLGAEEQALILRSSSKL